MASMMEELLGTLNEEQQQYQLLVDMSEKKRDVIVEGNIAELDILSAKEQGIASTLKGLEKRRHELLVSMADVTGMDKNNVTVTALIERLANQPKDAQALTEARDSLLKTAHDMQFLNTQNQILLQKALELVDFDLTLVKSMRQAPTTANYNNRAMDTGTILPSSGFDAKQ